MGQLEKVNGIEVYSINTDELKERCLYNMLTETDRDDIIKIIERCIPATVGQKWPESPVVPVLGGQYDEG